MFKIFFKFSAKVLVFFSCNFSKFSMRFVSKNCLKLYRIFKIFPKFISRTDDSFDQILKPCHGEQSDFSLPKNFDLTPPRAVARVGPERDRPHAYILYIKFIYIYIRIYIHLYISTLEHVYSIFVLRFLFNLRIENIR